MTRSIDETLMEESGEETETIDDTEPGSGGGMSDSYPLPGSALFTPINDNRNNLFLDYIHCHFLFNILHFIV